jgi:hypothetical protein
MLNGVPPKTGANTAAPVFGIDVHGFDDCVPVVFVVTHVKREMTNDSIPIKGVEV